jgi:hypothetical protein
MNERLKEGGEDRTPAVVPSPQTPLLKILEGMLPDRIAKKIETRKCHERAETEKIWTEID